MAVSESRKRKACSIAIYLSSLGVSDAGVAKVTALPLGVEAVALQLPQLKGGVEGTSLNLDGNGVDPDRHALYHFLRKAVLAENAYMTGKIVLNLRHFSSGF